MLGVQVKNGRSVEILTTIFVVIVFLFTWFSPRYSDDIIYSYFIPLDDSTSNLFQPMGNIFDLFMSQWNHYWGVNGRFVVHTLVQFFCAFGGRLLFSLINAVIWGCMPFIMLALTDKKYVTFKNELSCIVLLFLVFYKLPVTPAFQINYVWTALFNLIWLWLFLIRKQMKSWQLCFFALWSLMVGNCNESFSFPMGMAIIVFAINRKFRLELKQWIGGLLYGVGAILIICSPGQWLRLEEVQDKVVMNESAITSLLRFIEQLVPNLIVFLLLIVAVLFYRKYIEKCEWSFSIRLFGYTIAVTSLLVAVLLHTSIGRIIIAGNTFLSLIIISYLKTGEFPKASLYILSVIVMIMGSLKLIQIIESQKTDQSIRRQYVDSSDGVAYLPDKVFPGFIWNKNAWYDAEKKEFKTLYPEKSLLIIRPESMRGISNDRDTNMVVKLDDQAWLIVQSKSKPVDVVLNKTILPGVVDKKMSVRHIDLSDEFEQTFDSTDFWRAGIYVNTRPYIVSDISVDSGEQSL